MELLPADPLPTLYQYYTAGGVTSGLNADKSYFTLNEKNITLYSGAMHYFRTPKQLWRDRLRKMRAAGLNAVETYVPWNLHEPSPGQFEFGHGGTDMQDFLDIATFLKTAQEEDLLAIVRPGPYICAEWEFGGFPSWLLREPNIKFRTSDPLYLNPVKRFFNALLPILAALQFINGGPIVALQVENEYGSTSTSQFKPDKQYLKDLRTIYLNHDITSLLVTADGIGPQGTDGSLPQYFLVTANFGDNPREAFSGLEKMQPGRPKMAMEYYPGWFDHWGENHHTESGLALIQNVELILTYPGSFNLYMFHGGTSFGFMNGANLANSLTDNSGYQPDTTSYDYFAPINEAGDYTSNYFLMRTLLARYASPKTKTPPLPAQGLRLQYPEAPVTNHIPLKTLLDSDQFSLIYPHPTPMELLDINNGSGQSYGYIAYRKENISLPAGATLKITGHIRDTVLVLVNGKLVSPPLKNSSDLNRFGFWRQNNSLIVLTDKAVPMATVDLVVENWGRVGYGKLPQYYQFKGLWNNEVLINGQVVTDWIHIPLEFKNLRNRKFLWKMSAQGHKEPGLYRAIVHMDSPITDTYINMSNWTKGIVIFNRFVLGRYARIGPQQCLYLPAPFINPGRNEIIIFEHYEADDKIVFSTDQVWKTV